MASATVGPIGRGRPPVSSLVVGLGASALGASGSGILALLAMQCWRWLSLHPLAEMSQTRVPVADGLETLCVAGGGLVAVWLAVLLLIGAVASLPGHAAGPLRAGAVRLAPRLAPRVSSALVALALTALPIGSAAAAGPGPSPAATSPAAASPAATASTQAIEPKDFEMNNAEPQYAGRGQAPEPGWLPTRPEATPDPLAISLLSRGEAAADAVVVRRGDTLWDIAARHLGEDADAGAIAAAWPRWYAANKSLIGPDPDLILPGTRLVPPSPAVDPTTGKTANSSGVTP